MKIGFALKSSNLWQGGINYYKSLFSAINLHSSGNVSAFVLTDDFSFDAYASDYIEICHTKCLDGRRSLTGAISKASEKLIGYNPYALNVFKRNKVDIISHNSIGFQMDIVTLPWMPDFQHRNLPELFSRSDYLLRENFINDSIKLNRILLSSVAAKNDFENFYNKKNINSYVLRFPSIAKVTSDTPSVGYLKNKYGIDNGFFYLPNQFWVHKNHDVVIDALSKSSDKVVVVCSGGLEDYRHAQHISYILSKIKNKRLENRFIILGSIPYSDVVGLMEASIAVINPSRFEGWSTSVEEAKSLGKKILLSDIPVHREQSPERGIYFDCDDHLFLAELLDQALNDFVPDAELCFKTFREKNNQLAEVEFLRNYSDIITNILQNA